MAAERPAVAWRGVVDEFGDVWAWPTVLMEHREAFAVLPSLASYRARWRQWSPGDSIDFDPGATPEDRAKVEAWVKAANEAGSGS